jgi:hypothetical protein
VENIRSSLGFIIRVRVRVRVRFRVSVRVRVRVMVRDYLSLPEVESIRSSFGLQVWVEVTG